MPTPPPLTYPTFALDLLRARAALTVADHVGLALRAHRRVLRMSQRAYARHRGWSKGHLSRLEADAGRLRLCDVAAALRGTGYILALCREPAPPRGPDEPAPAAAVVRPEHWSRTELLARVRDGSRRFPAHHRTRQVTYPPSWWWATEATYVHSVAPDWYAPRPAPGLDPDADADTDATGGRASGAA
ncbi:hypothetical protein [uncultured Phycicoccus sp.]|uniref:hypothetical protein n=1 Tax=uncultured Phycicoccus sp. TaxID=661422 RepID=UPI002607280A|nr:hypothetical protein [uncultured Phycicoccus sp.]